MKQTIFKYKTSKQGDKSFEHTLDFIYTPPEGVVVKIGELLFTCEAMIDEFTTNQTAQIRRILLKEHNIS